MEIWKANNWDYDKQKEGMDKTMNDSSYEWPEVNQYHSFLKGGTHQAAEIVSIVASLLNDATSLFFSKEVQE